MKKRIWFIIIISALIMFNDKSYAAMPIKYSSVNYGYVTKSKNQGNTGTCVSFSSISAIETSLIKKGMAKNNIDLSEYQLAYLAHTFETNHFYNANNTSFNKNTFLTKGTNNEVINLLLSNNMDITKEQILSQKLFKTKIKPTKSQLNSGNVTIENSYRFESSKSKIKENIMKYGSIVTSYYSQKEYYNSNKSTYNLTSSRYKDTNHAIVIVGWDDNYSKNNFKYRPRNNGAWLVKNSWGTACGNKGYFWISYESKNMDSNSHIYDAVIDKKTYNRYEYDYSNEKLNVWGTQYQMNVFIPKNHETLSEVMFFTAGEDVTYEIYFYRGKFIKCKDMSKLTLLKKGKVKYEGYNTVKLDKQVLLYKNEPISIILSLKDKEGHSSAAVVDPNAYKYNKKFKSETSYIKYKDWEDQYLKGRCCKIKIATKRSIDFKFNKTSPCNVYNNITITPSVDKLITKKSYCYQIYNSKGKRIINTNYISNARYMWKPTIADKYTIKVYCKDLLTNKVVGREKSFKVSYPKLRVAFSKKTPQKRNTIITVKASISLSAKYRFRVFNSKGKLLKDSKITSKKSYNWKPTSKGTYKIKIDVKDLYTNRVINKTYTYRIK